MTVKWYAIYQSGLEKIIESGLTGTEYDVLLYLFSVMETETNIVHIRQADIQRKLFKMQNKNQMKDKGTISRSIKKLTDKRIIKIIKNGFMINPEIYYYGGNWFNLDDLIKEFDSTEE